GVVVVLSPKTKQWLSSGVAEPVRVAAAPAQPAQPEPAAAPAPEATPAPAPAATSEPAASPEPTQTVEVKEGNKGTITPAAVKTEEPKPVEAPAKVEEAKSAEEPVKVAEAAPAPVAAPVEPPAAQPAEEPKKAEEKASPESTAPSAATPAAPQTRKSRLTPPAPAPAAPENKKAFSRKPGSSQLNMGNEEKTFGQSVNQGLNLGTSEGGFEPPDWTQPFRDLQAGNIQTLDGGTKIVADGDVRLTLDTVQFAADHLFYDRLTGELHVSGNVEVMQGQSTAFADDIMYQIPANKKLEVPPPLAHSGEDVEQGLARKMLSLGNLDAKNIEINEPTRQLKAEHIVYDFTTKTGEAVGVEGHAGQVRFGGEKLTILGEEEMQGKNLWLTTCDCDHEYYKIRLKDAHFGKNAEVTGTGANLQIGSARTPIYWPRWSFSGGDAPTVGFDFDSGRKAKLGYYVNVGQQFAVTTDLKLGLRLIPTTKQGIGVGIDGSYDYMETPASPLFRGKGEFHTLYTTKDRGYTEWYHRQELTPDTVLLVQLEQWYDRDFYKDFFYERYKDRSDPRTFANVAYTQPAYIATATVRPRTNGFTTETERLPEATFHLLEREIAERLYLSFDTIAGYNNREPFDESAARSVNVARVSYDLQLVDNLNITPFLELEGSWYSKTRNDGGADTRFSSTAGVTVQTRFQKDYPGRWGFSEFKHLIVPSMTYSYRPEATMGIEDTPKFDAYDRVFGRSRIEGKVDNIILGRDAETSESWQVARLSLYHGTDFWNEVSRGSDYEMELEIRPRPWWGFMAVGESHTINDDIDFQLDEPYVVQRTVIQLYERLTDRRADPEAVDRYNASYGDYERVLAYFYYDDRPFNGRFNGRVGFAYTQTQGEVFNREVLYGAGYKLNEKWSLGFEHVFDLEKGDLSRQKYEVRRVMQCVEGAFQFSERESGWDVGVELSVTAFPGTRLKF
ncbi:MAG: LptA/OstA family protein, partial [Candidatus Hydrogenedentales bacterium]